MSTHCETTLFELCLDIVGLACDKNGKIVFFKLVFKTDTCKDISNQCCGSSNG